MPHLALDHDHDAVKENSPPPAVPVAIHDHQPSARSQHSMHFRQHVALAWVVMKAVSASHHIKGIVGERQSCAVSLDQLDGAPCSIATLRALTEHLPAQIQPVNAGLRTTLVHRSSELPRTAAYIQN